jgi:hypothetical protein
MFNTSDDSGAGWRQPRFGCANSALSEPLGRLAWLVIQPVTASENLLCDLTRPVSNEQINLSKCLSYFAPHNNSLTRSFDLFTLTRDKLQGVSTGGCCRSWGCCQGVEAAVEVSRLLSRCLRSLSRCWGCCQGVMSLLRCQGRCRSVKAAVKMWCRRQGVKAAIEVSRLLLRREAAVEVSRPPLRC